MEKRPIAVICPMSCEYTTLASLVKIENEGTDGIFTFAEGSVDGQPVVLVKCGIGMVNASAATALCIKKYSPSCIINQGTAGAHDEELKINDIILAERLVEICNYCSEPRGKGEGVNSESWVPLPSAIKRGEMHSDERLLSLAEQVPYEFGRVRRGCVGTGDAWNREYDRIAFLHSSLGTDCEEMESFAVAQVCAMFGVPFLGIRVISNNELVEGQSFTKDSAEYCQRFCYDVILKLNEN